MTLEDHVAAIAAAIGDARQGLPEPVFRLLGRITPVVNVDLLVRNERGETLLTCRQDDLYLGWHLPGGVVRFLAQEPQQRLELHLLLGCIARLVVDQRHQG